MSAAPTQSRARARNPLVLSLSQDGVRFERHLILATKSTHSSVPGLHKGGLYGYPHTMIHDEHLYVIISLHKEAVTALRVPLSSL